MFLTRICIGVDEALHARLTDAYAWHRGLWDAFPGRDGEPRDFLTRVDQKDRVAEALMLSPGPPAARPWGEWESREVAPGFLDHDRYLFSLRANPTVKRVVRDGTGARRKNGRRTRICSTEDLRAWLVHKASGSGFSTCDDRLSVGAPADQTSWRRNRQVIHSRVDYQGVLEVTDRERFHAAHRQGIGPAKAFGFGLLLLKPLS